MNKKITSMSGLLERIRNHWCSITNIGPGRKRGKRVRKLIFDFMLFALLRPLVRLIVSFVYLLIWQKLFTSWHIEPLGWLRFAFESLESSSSWTESSFEINVLLESSAEAQTPLSDLRAQNSDVEAELFARIRALESQLAHGIPPQLNPGEYESLVRENLDNSINLNHYRNSLSNEFFELQILEFKVRLQDLLFQTMLSEPRLEHILNVSPYNDIRAEAFDFLESKVEPVNDMRHNFSKNILDGSLRYYIKDMEQKGSQSLIYRAFYSHFTDEEFRRLIDPNLRNPHR